MSAAMELVPRPKSRWRSLEDARDIAIVVGILTDIRGRTLVVGEWAEVCVEAWPLSEWHSLWEPCND